MGSKNQNVIAGVITIFLGAANIFPRCGREYFNSEVKRESRNCKFFIQDFCLRMESGMEYRDMMQISRSLKQNSKLDNTLAAPSL
jgi:hypothetical protein